MCMLNTDTPYTPLKYQLNNSILIFTLKIILNLLVRIDLVLSVYLY